MSKHNWIPFIIQNHTFRPISGHPQVHGWFFKHIEGETYIMLYVLTQCTFLNTHYVGFIYLYNVYVFVNVLKTSCEPEDGLR
jgi:hypothetical protein